MQKAQEMLPDFTWPNNLNPARGPSANSDRARHLRRSVDPRSDQIRVEQRSFPLTWITAIRSKSEPDNTNPRELCIDSELRVLAGSSRLDSRRSRTRTRFELLRPRQVPILPWR
jgi:hypothetical protein